MNRHTPGPWLLRDKSDSVHEACATHPFGRQIFRFHGGFEGEEAPSDADVRLILAAPDLLIALRDLLHAYSTPNDRVCCDGRDCGCMGITEHQQAEHYAEEAIAKATGGAS